MQDQPTPATGRESTRGVYFIQAKDCPDGLIKIGYSDDVEKRLTAHQIGSPQPLQILGIIKDAPSATERRLHRRFAEDRVSGEWFRPTDQIVRLARGEEPFLVALAARGDAAKWIQVPTTVVDDLLDEIIEFAGPQGGVRYWYEDLEHIAKRVEEERIKRATRDAVALVRRRLRSAIEGAVSPASVAECVAEVLGVDADDVALDLDPEDAAL